MDSSSWIHGYAANSGGGGGNSGYSASCIPSVLQCREEQLRGSKIHQHLNQISMHLNVDDVEPAVYAGVPSGDICPVVDDFDFLPSHHAAGGCSFPSSSSTSSSFCSASLSCSPESSTAAHVLVAPATGLQFPEVSSLLAPGVMLPYDDHYVANVQDTLATMAPGGTPTKAFRPYERHLAPQRRLTKPASGQRMFKTAMSVLDKMHKEMRYNQQQYYYQQQQASAAEPSGNQLQHMISERKRREKLNDSFHALKTVLPPGSKKDKTSILITAREYVNSLKSKVCELEEKNLALQAQLARRATSGAGAEEDDAKAGEKVEIQITAMEGDQSGEVCTVKIAARPARGNTTDMVLMMLQCLKDQIGEDVSVVWMSTGEDGDGPNQAILTLHLKSASGAKWEEEVVREAVTKALTSPATAGHIFANLHELRKCKRTLLQTTSSAEAFETRCITQKAEISAMAEHIQIMTIGAPPSPLNDNDMIKELVDGVYN